MSLSQNFSNVRPSLMLDFAGLRKLDPRITFARASTATYYDGFSSTKAEENLLLQSQQFFSSGTAWVPLNATGSVEDSAIAPDGTTTADLLIASTTNGGHRLRQTIGVAATYTFSVYVKPSGYNFVSLNDGLFTNYATFNLSTGAVSSTGGTATNAAITSAANGYYRCSVTVPLGTSGPHIFVMSDAVTNSFVGDGVSGLLLWGAQLEQRSSLTAYTPTATTPISNNMLTLQTAASGDARFDHNPITGESLGLLIEEARTNLLTRSEEFDHADWSNINMVCTANSIIAPDGNQTAEKINIATSITSNSAATRQDVSKAATAAPYTMTVYAKAGEFNSVRLLPRDAVTAGNNVSAYFNLATGTVDTPVASGTFTSPSAAIFSVGNGWYRCSITFTSSTETSLRSQFLIYNNGSSSVTGNDYSGIYVWGAQLEAGSFATSYIPTVATTVTRAADSASMTGTNFSSWFNSAEGCWYADWYDRVQSLSHQLFSVYLDGVNRYAMTVNSSNVLDAAVVAGGADTLLSYSVTLTAGNHKGAFSYKKDDGSVSVDGLGGTQDSSLTLPSGINAMVIGTNTSGTQLLNSTIKKLAYYPKRLTNTQLQALTS